MMMAGMLNDPVDTPMMLLPVPDALHLLSVRLGDRSHPGQKSIDDPPPPPPPHHHPPPPPPPPPPTAAFVVIVNGADTHPTVSVVVVVVEFTADDVALTMIVSPELVVPVSVVNGVLLMLYSPPTTETTACALIPDMVTGLDAY